MFILLYIKNSIFVLSFALESEVTLLKNVLLQSCNEFSISIFKSYYKLLPR